MKKKLLFSASTIAIALFSGCGLFKYSTQYYKNNYPKVEDTSMATKGGVSITLSGMELNEYFKSEYAVEYETSRGKDGYIYTQKTVINLFWGLTPYWVEIENNTGNVLSLQDSRIALILQDSPEPIFALSKQELIDLSKAKELPCIKFELKQLARKYPQSKSWAGVDDNLQKEVTKMVREKPIISRTSEILPGMKSKGWVVFPYDSERIKTTAEISFIDVRSNTDEAGQTTLKTRFDFKIKAATSYVKREYDEVQRKYSQYIPITEEEYNASQQPKSK
jgi:hypothetical protein